MSGKSAIASNPSTSVLPFQVCCQFCSNIYTWENSPVLLSCHHTICNECLESSYSFRDPYAPLVEIACLICTKSGKPSLQYPACNGNSAKFFQLNFTIDYGLLTYVYRHFTKEAFAAEQMIRGLPESIMVEYKEDEEYMEDTDEKSMEERYKVNRSAYKENLYVKIANAVDRKYCCQYCSRLFNKRNVPINMGCGHVVCEFCIVREAKEHEEKCMVFRCFCGSGAFAVKTNIPPNYLLNLIVRKLMPINKGILEEIYEKVSIDAKKSAWEFSFRKDPSDPAIIFRLCCHACKEPFVELAPYIMSCGHNTCLSCAFKIAHEHRTLYCAIDGKETKIGRLCKDAIALREKLQENTDLKDYIKVNYTNLDEEYPPEDPEEKECPVCLNEYDFNERQQYYMCQSKHTVCEACLKAILKKNLKSDGKGNASIECINCNHIITIPYDSQKDSIENCIKFFKPVICNTPCN